MNSDSERSLEDKKKTHLSPSFFGLVALNLSHEQGTLTRHLDLTVRFSSFQKQTLVVSQAAQAAVHLHYYSGGIHFVSEIENSTEKSSVRLTKKAIPGPMSLLPSFSFGSQPLLIPPDLNDSSHELGSYIFWNFSKNPRK